MKEVHVGIATLTRATRKKLRELNHIEIIHYRRVNEPAAVLIPYWMWTRLNFMLAAARDVESSSDAK